MSNNDAIQRREKMMNDRVCFSMTFDVITGVRDLMMLTSLLRDVANEWACDYDEDDDNADDDESNFCCVSFQGHSAEMVKMIHKQFPLSLATALASFDDLTKKQTPEIKREFHRAQMSFVWHMPRAQKLRLLAAFANPVYGIYAQSPDIYTMSDKSELAFSELKPCNIQVAGM
jgi:hypothetical protein